LRRWRKSGDAIIARTDVLERLLDALMAREALEGVVIQGRAMIPKLRNPC
jgi:hypothetical protein